MGISPSATIGAGGGAPGLLRFARKFNLQSSDATGKSTLANPTYTNPSGGQGTLGYETLAGIGTQQQNMAEQQNAYALALNSMTARNCSPTRVISTR